MIRLGLANDQKSAVIAGYLREHKDIETVLVFSPEAFPLDCAYEQYGWNDIIMYKTFYPLLERISGNYLIVVNELLRTSSRSDLTYNCLHHYLNQTPHHIVFQWFPIIDDAADMMILADNDHPGRYKGRGLHADIIGDLDIDGYDRRPQITVTPVPVPDGAEAAYVAEREKLFDTLGNRDPDIIPRHLHEWAGRYKKALIDQGKKYVARNQRFKLPNIVTYKTADDAGRISIDLPHRRIELNDYLYRTQADTINFLSTPFNVDKYYAGELTRWHEKAGEIYAQTGLRLR